MLHALRPEYQTKMHEDTIAFMKSDAQRGQIYSPTGSGKTILFFHLINWMTSQRKSLNICFLHPRLALSQEQQARFKTAFGTTFATTSFHSGQPVRGNEAIRELGTTNCKELEFIINQNSNHVTFSSYDSFHRIADINFDLVVFDEAHNAVSPKFNKQLPALVAKKVLFYTATPITDKDTGEVGMTNPDMFGEVISKVYPKDLFRKQFIVPPLIHHMDVTTDTIGNAGGDTVSIVAKAFKHQQNETNMMGVKSTKMLITSRGYQDHENVEDNTERLIRELGQFVDVFVIEASESRKNGNRLPSRFEAIKQINEHPGNCIIMHFDTIAEGIDIDSLTGALMLRNVKKYKFIQTMGRCARILPNKKYSIITLPVVDGEYLSGALAEDFVEAFRDGGYGDIMDYVSFKDDKQQPRNEKGDEIQAKFAKLLGYNVIRDVDWLIENGIIEM